MLGISHETKLSVQLWKSLPSRASLPCPLEEFLDIQIGQRAVFNSKRLHARKPLRTAAIALLADGLHACYVKDISRMGVGFYAPINLLPKKIVRLWLPNGKILQLSITRCRRRCDNCFECGGTFHLATALPSHHVLQSN